MVEVEVLMFNSLYSPFVICKPCKQDNLNLSTSVLQRSVWKYIQIFMFCQSLFFL